MEPSIHDDRLLSCTVSAEERKITLKTMSEDGKERTEVESSGVEGYDFERDNFGTIIFDVIEKSPARIVAENEDLFENGRSHCWPTGGDTSKADLLERFQKRGTRG